jgi:hypothetical protein
MLRMIAFTALTMVMGHRRTISVEIRNNRRGDVVGTETVQN